MKKRIDRNHNNPRYFETETGETFVPIGLNLSFCRGTETMSESEVLERYRFWMTEFARNGGNFMRVWLSVPFFDVMPEKIGQYDSRNCDHIRFVVNLAEELGLKIKFTLEHFRTIAPAAIAESFPGVVSFNKPLYADLAADMSEYLTSEPCKNAYLDKARYLAAAGFGESPAVVAWELWNEINCIAPIAELAPWSDFMIAELGKIFPRQMIVQNLGSFSSADGYKMYDYLGTLAGNAFLQVHRYLDPGAELDVCRGPMDLLAADSIRELHARNASVPAILAESGAVEANHSCYSHLYADDPEGTLLHDILFAPFFAGSAGCGQPWHWDHLYIEKHALWHHFKRFARAVEGIDPVAENFRPFYTETRHLRIYGLRGVTRNLLWCRDKQSDWQSELVDGCPAETLHEETIPVDYPGECACYLPWEDRRATAATDGETLTLPPFRRSIVVCNQKN